MIWQMWLGVEDDNDSNIFPQQRPRSCLTVSLVLQCFAAAWLQHPYGAVNGKDPWALPVIHPRTLGFCMAQWGLQLASLTGACSTSRPTQGIPIVEKMECTHTHTISCESSTQSAVRCLRNPNKADEDEGESFGINVGVLVVVVVIK